MEDYYLQHQNLINCAVNILKVQKSAHLELFQKWFQNHYIDSRVISLSKYVVLNKIIAVLTIGID